MANVSKLVYEFATMDGETVTMSYNYAKADVTVSAVKTLANALVNNGDIFAKVPVAAKSAKIVTTSESEYDLDA